MGLNANKTSLVESDSRKFLKIRLMLCQFMYQEFAMYQELVMFSFVDVHVS